jgi:diketogulonate reductase-like aldo/keto reductase
MKNFKFKNGETIPALGFGTWKLEEANAYKATLKALEIGYRHIDTADKYGNHKEVGQAILDSGVARKDIFLTTKVWYSELSPTKLNESVKRFLEELQTEYIDLLLIHWPNKGEPIAETLKAMERLKEKQTIRNIGVSNFTIHHLKDCLETGVEIVNNQVELHPTFGQFELEEFAKENGILITAYSPLGRGADLELPVLKEIAHKHNKSVPQVILNWIVSRGIVAIPKGTSEDHIKENFRALDFELSTEDVRAISDLDKGERLIDNGWSEFDY